jgi:hypothetical protein
VGGGETPEVPLAVETGPLSEHGERQDFALGEQRWAAGLAGGGLLTICPPVVHEHLQ